MEGRNKQMKKEGETRRERLKAREKREKEGRKKKQIIYFLLFPNPLKIPN